MPTLKISPIMNSIDGTQGASLKIDADNLGYARSIAGGESNAISFSYFAESGDVQANYFTPLPDTTKRFL